MKRVLGIFDKAWAISLMKEAAQLHEKRAQEKTKENKKGIGALKRVELLQLRFKENLPIREIALLWNVEAAVLHKEYAHARREFKAALLEVVRFHYDGSPAEVERECINLLEFVN